ncbi:class I SAM-dependent methyltransferase, partial [Candidatus Woesebacteria bacterium]|nr:class I SAM-dependent methyltransferase [Candidatus Woesebacteria bacterium]
MEHNYFTRSPNLIEKRTIGKGRTTIINICSFLVTPHDYAQSFGFQWKRYAKVQIDRFNGTQITQGHLAQLLGFPLSRLKNLTVLEVGSGAGRYTDLFRTLAHHVITVDPSAISSNVAIGASNLTAVRADLFDLPINSEKIDLVFCRGVLQHTQDPIAAIKQLCTYVKVGGLVAFD